MSLNKSDLNTVLIAEERKTDVQNAVFKTKAQIASDGKFIKQSTLVGKIDGEIIGGIKTIGQTTNSPEEVITSGIGLLTDQMPSLSGINIPDISQSQFLSINHPDAGDDSDGTGLSTVEVTSTITTLTGLPAIKCNNPNSGMEVVTDGTPQSIVECTSLVESKTAESMADIKAFTQQIESLRPQGLGGSGFFSKISGALSILKIGDMLPEIEALAPIREFNDKLNGFKDKIEAGIKEVGGELYAGIEDAIDQVGNATGISGMIADIKKFKNELPSFDELSDVLPSGFDNVLDAADDYIKDAKQFTDQFDVRIDEGVGGVLQNIAEGLTGDAHNTIANLIDGGISATEGERRAILKKFALGTDQDKVNATKELAERSKTGISEAMKEVFESVPDAPTVTDLNNSIVDEARRRGVPEDEIAQASETLATVDAEIKKLDTTISGSVIVPAELFDESVIITDNNQKWSGKNTEDDAFTYISSVEELDSEFVTATREITEVVVHATETYTNKDIGAIEINNIQIELGQDGIGYHYVIRRDGRLQRGRPINREGEHAVENGHDKYSVGIALVGGINISSGDDNPTEHRSAQSFTRQQYTTLEKFLRSFYKKYSGGQVFGHNDIDINELDPYFDVQDYIESVFRKTNQVEEPSTQGPLTPTEINNDN